MKSFEKDLHRYVRNALNRSITKIAKEQRELIKLDYALSNKKIRNLTKISRAKQDKLEATIANAKVALSINNFKRFQNKQGVRVKIAKNKTLFFKGAFLGVRQGGSKSDNKSGFMATRYKDNLKHTPFEASASTIYSHKNAKSPRASKVFYFKTKPFSLIAIDKTKALQKKAIAIFEAELAKE
ncbi:hypothetical protein [uncultured Helicobacter sp.]|uniref:hypothetical protein n=4 Tax=uncultured Helicobacter sp. TaxID=175537 RepID=UPI0025E340B7|nr:hypothetical protein [uncultured Helicobacter sp.]